MTAAGRSLVRSRTRRRSRPASTGTRRRASSASVARSPVAWPYPATTTIAVERSGCDADRAVGGKAGALRGVALLRDRDDLAVALGDRLPRVLRQRAASAPIAASGRARPATRPDRGGIPVDRPLPREEHDGGRPRRGARPRPRRAWAGSGSRPSTCVFARRLGGDVRGAYTMDSWLRRTDGLLLRRTFGPATAVSTRSSAPCRHTRSTSCGLRSLTPGTETAARWVNDSQPC